MAGHTPGPWSVGPTHHESEGKSWLFYSDQTHILAPNGLTDVAIVEAGEEEGQANARLIAAAPDLLAACECALYLGEIAVRNGLEGFGKADEDEIVADHVILKAIRQAITKAKGD
jgi:hypothetical protein